MTFDPNMWAWPQWCFFVLMLLTLIGYAVKHGQPREDYNAFVGFINFGLSLFLLIAGGFFA